MTLRVNFPNVCRQSITTVIFICGVIGSWAITGANEKKIEAEFAQQKADAEKYFQKKVVPFLKTYCLRCHQNRRPTRAGVNFNPTFKAPGHAAFSELWKKAVARVDAHDMPPDSSKKQPTAEERKIFSSWLGKVKYLSKKDPGEFVIRRLTKTEYGNTLQDLFGVESSIVDSLPDEVSGEGFLNSLSPLQMEQYLAIAEKVLDKVLSSTDSKPTPFQKKWVGESPPEADARKAAQTIAKSLAHQAYRRPPTEKELEVLLQVFDLGRQKKLNYLASVRLMLKAILVSPQFLFITPAEEAEAGIVPLDDHQLASRLSYLLWGSMPDEELMKLADRGKLHEAETLKAQVKRLLMHPRSRALFDGFGAQWLGIGDLENKVFDSKKFPQMTREMRSAMVDEVRLLFENVVRENRNVMDLIESDYTFLNQTLASIYDLEDEVKGPQMRKVKLTDTNRGGLLGLPGILAATSFPNRTSPVIRGVWVLERVLGDNVPSAPPDVPELEPQSEKSTEALTLRERTERHTSDPVCANCHRILDPIGFGLENFDAIGRWRDKDDNGKAIDATGELPGGKRFSNPRDLKSIIAGRVDAFSRNIVERLLAYALCRKLEGYDEIVVDRLMVEVARNEYRMQELILSVVTSYPFTHRRIPKERNSK